MVWPQRGGPITLFCHWSVHPKPMHTHDWLGQLMNRQVAPASQSSVHEPPPQSIVHVDPAAQALRQ